MLNNEHMVMRPETKTNDNLRLIDCITWGIRAGLIVRFYTTRTAHQMLYCCTLESRIGIKTKTYDIKEASLNACLYHIEKYYGNIFSELSCPPWPRKNSLG